MLRLSWRSWLSRSAPRVGPWWVHAMWTAVFCVAVAIGFTLVSMPFASPGGIASQLVWWTVFRVSLVMSFSIGISIRVAFALGDAIVGRTRLARAVAWQRSVYYAAIPLLGVALGWPLGMYWSMGIDARRFFSVARPDVTIGSVLLVLVVTTIFQQFFASKARQIRAEKQATEAQLRLLQAQMEPHFLFNTLANVASLMESDTGRAKAMLESFVDYLRASLSGLGGERHTLGQELDLVEAYLRIVKVRMDDRLSVVLDVPASLRTLRLPPLTLQPLVENAIVHGLEPRIHGGALRIGARVDGPLLVVTVDDDGSGLGHSDLPAATSRNGSGTALANIRRRLEQLYGSEASLRVEAVPSHGVRASLSLPVTA